MTVPRTALFPTLLLPLLAACGQLSPDPAPTVAPQAAAYDHVLSFGGPGDGDGQFSTTANIAVDKSGNMYVLDFADRVQKFGPDGGFITKWGSNGGMDGQFSGPWGIGLDNDGNVLVADWSNSRIQKFDAVGTFMSKWGSNGGGDGQFSGPWGVAVGKDGAVYVVDANNNRVQKFAADGSFITKWGSAGSGDGQFNYPSDIAVDSEGNVYVVNNSQNRVQKFSSSGEFVSKWGTAGSGAAQFSGPWGIAVGADDKVYVADTSNNRIQVFTSDGTYITEITSAGTGGEPMNGPLAVEVDSKGYVYVVDLNSPRVHVFAPAQQQQNQTLSFTSAAPTAAQVGGSYTPIATATSGLSVTIASTTSGVCTFADGTVSFVAAGTCTLSASQAGNDDYEAAVPVEQSFTVSAAPQPLPEADRYLIDFESAPANRLVYSVKLGSGVVHQGGNAPKQSTVPVVGKRRLNGRILDTHLARVVSFYGSKRLVIASPNSNTPAPTGGRVKLTFTNFDPKGVTLTSLRLSNLTAKGATLTFYYADGSSSRQNLGTTAKGGSLVVPINVKGLRAVDVYAPNAFAVDDVGFSDEPDALQPL